MTLQQPSQISVLFHYVDFVLIDYFYGQLYTLYWYFPVDTPIIIIIMKTVESFFATRTNTFSRRRKMDKTYSVLHKLQENSKEYKTIEPKSNHNIFDLLHGQPQPFMQKCVDRPIGGLDLFNKMEQIAKFRCQNKKNAKSTRDSVFRKASTSMSNNRPKFIKAITENQEKIAWPSDNLEPKKIITEISQQIFKSHTFYQTSRPVKSSLSKSSAVMIDQNSINKKISKDEVGNKILQGVKSHLDKKALLGQIDRKRPLVQLCGQYYFQLTLRNRFMEDLKMPDYLYSIKDQFSDNRTISKIRKLKPQIKERKRLITKGRAIRQLN